MQAGEILLTLKTVSGICSEAVKSEERRVRNEMQAVEILLTLKTYALAIQPCRLHHAQPDFFFLLFLSFVPHSTCSS